ncbi:hypothetical protein B0H19DRAFT_1239596, partial [Mycena capillaripes]
MSLRGCRTTLLQCSNLTWARFHDILRLCFERTHCNHSPLSPAFIGIPNSDEYSWRRSLFHTACPSRLENPHRGVRIRIRRHARGFGRRRRSRSCKKSSRRSPKINSEGFISLVRLGRAITTPRYRRLLGLRRCSLPGSAQLKRPRL